jgi:hypothetical protein
MTEYVITYFGGNPPASAEEGAQNMQEYRQWMNSLGESAVSPANTQTIASNCVCDKGSATQMSGFTIIKADTMDDAMSIAQACPFLKTGGTLEVGESMVMSG